MKRSRGRYSSSYSTQQKRIEDDERMHIPVAHGTDHLVCCQCGATQTPQWREGPAGPKTLCNACGVKYYRQANRTRKAGMGAKSKARRARAPPKRVVPAGESSDEFTTLHMHMNSATSESSEDMEERDAAMSLLCFAGVEPDMMDMMEAEPAENSASPATQEVALMEPAVGTTLDLLAALLSANQLPGLQQLQEAVQQAYKQAQAAQAATVAVAQFLHEKQEEAHHAHVRVSMAEQMLLEEMRHLEQLCPLTKVMSTAQQV